MTSVAAAAELAQDNDGQAVLHEKIDQKNGTMPSWPSTLRELYLECLYAPAPATTKDADTRSSSKATGEVRLCEGVEGTYFKLSYIVLLMCLSPRSPNGYYMRQLLYFAYRVLPFPSYLLHNTVFVPRSRQQARFSG